MDNSSNNYHNRKYKKSISILLNLIFYSMLLLLVGILIYPHTSFYYQKKFYSPFEMRLNKDDIFLEKGKSDKLYVIAINKRVSYTSTDFKVADVNMVGKVYGNKVGKAVIKAKVDHREFKCRVHVIDINKDKLTLSIGKSKKLKIYGTWGKVTWVSKNNNIAKVNRFGKVVGINKGKTTIIARVKGIEITCKVTIIK